MPDPVAEQLTARHRRRQLAIRAEMVAETLLLSGPFDIDSIDETWPPIEAALTTTVASLRERSADQAVRYYRTFRQVVHPSGQPTVRRADPRPRRQIRATLNLRGPIETKKRIREVGPGQLRVVGRGGPMGPRTVQLARETERMLSRLVGSTSRQVMQGGRQTLARSVGADSDATGWQRITDSNPCAFCALLASRGPVFHTRQSGGFQAHDHCACTAAPVYGGWEPSELQQSFRDLYDTSARGERDQLAAFRAAYRRSAQTATA